MPTRAFCSQAYTYCPGCGDWPESGNCCATGGTEAVEAYFARLDFARERGFLNRCALGRLRSARYSIFL